MSLLTFLATLSEDERSTALREIPNEVLEFVMYDWVGEFARESQLPPDEKWDQWVFVSGRASGKTRAAAEQVRKWAEENPGCRIALVAPTAADARDTMIEGESGLLAICPPWDRPTYEPSKRRLTWPNGSQAFTYSAEEPDRLRGPQFHYAWGDEVATWKYDQDTIDMLRLTLRLGKNPQVIYTTTPRPTELVKELLKKAEGNYITRGSTLDNAENLPTDYLKAILKRYEGTRLGRQEIYAEVLEDLEGAIVAQSMINKARVDAVPLGPMFFSKIVVAVDPATTANKKSDMTGIIVAGITTERQEIYILADLTLKGSPDEWAKKAVQAYHDYDASYIVAEVNQGGQMVVSTLQTVDRTVPVKTVHASKGKHIRFAPVGALYEQLRIHHVGRFASLEQEVCSFTLEGFEGKNSPDRADAAVYAVTELALLKKGRAAAFG